MRVSVYVRVRILFWFKSQLGGGRRNKDAGEWTLANHTVPVSAPHLLLSSRDRVCAGPCDAGGGGGAATPTKGGGALGAW